MRIAPGVIMAVIGEPPSPENPHPAPAMVCRIPVPASISRTRQFVESVKKRLPFESCVRPPGPVISACVASPPLPVRPAVPLPAMVVIVPKVSMRRMRLVNGSENTSRPWESINNEVG